MTDPIEGIAFYAVFVFAVTVHEASHAWAAMRGGDPTAYSGGQVSLDPLPHMRREPFGMVILPILTLVLNGFPIGWASAPYDPNWAARHPRRAGWMALAGPASNLGLTLLAALAIHAGVRSGFFVAPEYLAFTSVTAAAGEPGSLAAATAMLLSIAFSMNLLLFLLNMLPVPPLDGSGALVLLLPEAWVGRYRDQASQPMLALLGLAAVWYVIPTIFGPVFVGLAKLFYPEVRYG